MRYLVIRSRFCVPFNISGFFLYRSYNGNNCHERKIKLFLVNTTESNTGKPSSREVSFAVEYFQKQENKKTPADIALLF